MSTNPLAASRRSESKEAYRLWFQFLKRAIADESANVNQELYASWGDVTAYKFEKWWREVGRGAVESNGSGRIDFATKGQKVQDDQFLIVVPKSLTSTEAGNQLRELLLSIAHKHTPRAATLSITEGVELRLATVRAWLHTYDCNQILLAEQRAGGGKQKAIGGRALLAAVRKFYLDHAERYKRSKSKIDRVPFPLFSDGSRLVTEADDINALTDAVAIAAAKRYLKSADAIIASVAVGKFPS